MYYALYYLLQFVTKKKIKLKKQKNKTQLQLQHDGWILGSRANIQATAITYCNTTPINGTYTN